MDSGAWIAAACKFEDPPSQQGTDMQDKTPEV